MQNEECRMQNEERLPLAPWFLDGALLSALCIVHCAFCIWRREGPNG